MNDHDQQQPRRDDQLPPRGYPVTPRSGRPSRTGRVIGITAAVIAISILVVIVWWMYLMLTTSWMG